MGIVPFSDHSVIIIGGRTQLPLRDIHVVDMINGQLKYSLQCNNQIEPNLYPCKLNRRGNIVAFDFLTKQVYEFNYLRNTLEVTTNFSP